MSAEDIYREALEKIAHPDDVEFPVTDWQARIARAALASARGETGT